MARDRLAKFRMTADQARLYEDAAQRQGTTFSAFARRALDRAASGLTNEVVRSDLIAVRRRANEVEELAKVVDAETAAKIRLAVADLRRVAQRHLQPV